MAMGKTERINMNAESLNNVRTIIESYQQDTDGLATSLQAVIQELIPAGFSGSAATNFQNVYENEIHPILTTDLTKLLGNLDKITLSILNGIPAQPGVDEKLADENSKVMMEV